MASSPSSPSSVQPASQSRSGQPAACFPTLAAFKCSARKMKAQVCSYSRQKLPHKVHGPGQVDVQAGMGATPEDESPVVPSGRTRQKTRMLPFRSWTSLYSRRFSSTVAAYFSAIGRSSSVCASPPLL